jgi:hypothetical protein
MKIRTRALACVVVSLGVFLGVFGAGPTRADAACTRLVARSIGLNKCVVYGNQATLNQGNVTLWSYSADHGLNHVAGHRSSHGGVFRKVPALRNGDVVTYAGKQYVVFGRQAGTIGQSIGLLMLTQPQLWNASNLILQTCTGGNSVVMVYARPV